MSEIIGEGELRRFFDQAAAVKADDGWIIELDGRTVKTPSGTTFVAPAQALAERIADEWNAQGDKIVPASMPLASLVNAAIDRVSPAPQVFIDQLIGYAGSDLLCYWADAPDDLVARQQEEWQPVLDWARDNLGAPLTTTSGIVPVEQPDESIRALSRDLSVLDAYCLAGLVDLAGSLKSVLLALAVWKKFLDAEQAFRAAFLDELYQEAQWGEDQEAVQRRSMMFNEVASTATYLMLLES